MDNLFLSCFPATPEEKAQTVVTGQASRGPMGGLGESESPRAELQAENPSLTWLTVPQRGEAATVQIQAAPGVGGGPPTCAGGVWGEFGVPPKPSSVNICFVSWLELA